LADVNHHCSAAATLELCLCLAACSWVVHVRVGQVGAPAHTLILGMQLILHDWLTDTSVEGPELSHHPRRFA
jgi:hypothetical protein